MKKILIPVDGSEFSTRALEKGKEIAKAFSSSIVILNIIDIRIPISDQAGMPLDEEIELSTKLSSEKILKKAREQISDLTEKVETITLQGRTAPIIEEYAQNNKVDLIVMGSQGLGSGVPSALIGSVTNKVIHNTTIPVLVVK
ncbi:MAG: universal stress protein [Eubacteriaceae bacterium]|nr:universal stress protein [Eubacteriaceae bacterium]